MILSATSFVQKKIITKNTIIFIAFLTLGLYSMIMSTSALKLYADKTAIYEQYVELESSYKGLIKDYTVMSELASATSSRLSNLETEYSKLSTNFTEVSNSIIKLTDTVSVLEAENLSLVASNQEYYTAICEYEKREELYNKYEYAIYDRADQRTDITYDQLQTAEKLCEEKGVDIDYLLSTIMVESNGNAKAKNKYSSASGYGQLINGTAKFVYEKIMKNGTGTYSIDKAMNGNTNIKMTIEYIAYLQESNNGNMRKVVRSYRGLEDKDYVKKINSYLAEKDKSLKSIEVELKNNNIDT